MISLAAQLAWRFRSSKRQNGFISFISASSTLGIALGCFVLILLLSVMNGFEKELKSRILSVIPHGEIWSVSTSGIVNWQAELSKISADKRVMSVEPYSKATGMLQKGKVMKAVELTGISPDFANGNALLKNIDSNQWLAFTKDKDGLIIGSGAAKKLNVRVGDKVQLVLPQLSDNGSLKAPLSRWFTVQGTISIGGELDNHIGFLHLSTTAEILGNETGAYGLKVQFYDPFIAPYAMRQIGYNVEQHIYMSDWTRTQGHLYQDIQLVRTVVYIALSLVIAVACFNIVATLVMGVNEKQGEIAMLKTMGAKDSLIITSFVLQGFVNAIMGTFVGVFAGVIVSLNLAEIAATIEQLIGVKFLSGDIYFINFLPSDLRWHEVYLTTFIALFLSLIATIYPAKKAASINPAEALGHY